MITSLKIERFRGIKEGRLDNLSRINLLVGSNNSGKSSILEAINLLYSLTNKEGAFGEDIIENLARKRVRRPAYYPSLWYKYDDKSPIDYEIKFDNGLELKADFNKERKWRIKEPSLKDSKKSTDILQGFDELFTRSNEIQYLSEALKSVIIDAEMVKNFAIIEKEILPAILQKRVDKKLIEMLNEAYETEIESLSYVPFSGENYALLLMLKDYSVRIDEFGDGVKHALAILSIILGMDVPLLLLEEPEMHQHPKAFGYLAKSLSSLTSKSATQIFITTHSLGLIDAFLDIFKEEDISLYHLSLKAGKLDARKIEVPDTKVLEDLGIDIRSLESYII